MNGATAAVSSPAAGASLAALTASPSQRAAIEAGMGPVLVIAGPGAGKTFCLIERIRYLIERCAFDPASICAFTFTNKAAEEIAVRLRELGPAGARVRRGTIHAFCAELLREFGDAVGLRKGFGIADEDYQRAVLGRCGVPWRIHTAVLRNFSLHRLRGDPLDHRDTQHFTSYNRILRQRNQVDFDGLVLKADELLERVPSAAAQLRARWRYVLVDEFQDVNPVQYSVMRRLVQDHQNLFAVGDDEQSIFSWTGADPRLFHTFKAEFSAAATHQLQENHRCPEQTFAVARRLILRNQEVFSQGRDIRTYRRSAHPVRALSFDTERQETAWLLEDLRRDRDENDLEWSDYALLYRRHEIGDALEASFVSAGIPCRLAQGRALSDDPAIAYVVAALRVIATPLDAICKEQFLRVVLPRRLCADLEARAQEHGETMYRQMLVEAHRRKRDDPEGRKLRRARVALSNLESLGSRHTELEPLVRELLSQRVGPFTTELEKNSEDLRDPAEDPDVVALADRLDAAARSESGIWIAPSGGIEIPLRAMLLNAGLGPVAHGAVAPPGSMALDAGAVSTAPLILRVFKALQLLVSRRYARPFLDFTAIDIETTDKALGTAEVVEIAAVRVRAGKREEEFRAFVRPRTPITPEATAVHGITNDDVRDAPTFAEVWPVFREFCGGDTLVAHNGWEFDFPILQRLSRACGGGRYRTFDTLLLAKEVHRGRHRLEDIALAYGIGTGTKHRALDDARTLAQVCLRLDEKRLARARKTALVNVIDHLGIALALADRESFDDEANLLLNIARGHALSRYSEALDHYQAARESSGDPSLPTLEQLIERLGGRDVMERVRAARSPEQRYPAAMARLQRLMAFVQGETLGDQIAGFLEHVALSARTDGEGVQHGRVALLTLHATKGLEFSRVYVVGVEDAELPGHSDVEEGRRLLYVGMTRAQDRLVLTRVGLRNGRPTGGHQFLTEMGLTIEPD